MPVLPPQLPALVGDDPAAAPAIVMSRKSQSCADKLLTVSVRVVPRMLERKKMRRTAVAPATVRVPVMVWLALNIRPLSPALDGALNVSVLNVFAPFIVGDSDALVLENDTLLKTWPPPSTVMFPPPRTRVEVPALNVRFVLAANTGELEFVVTVLDPSVIVLTLELLDDKEPAVTLKFLVSNVPLVTVRVLLPMFSASASWTVPP